MITLYISNFTQNEKNTIYPKKVEISDVGDLREAVGKDYVCAKYKNNRRGNDNFMESDCVPFDIDNDHTDDEGKWIAPKDVADAFPDVEFYVHYSRNHMKEKDGKSARPRFHVLFRIKKTESRDDYVRLKNEVHRYFLYVDNNALDAARFFFGTDDPKVDHFEGEDTLDEFMCIYSLNDMDYRVDENGEVIDDDIDLACSKEIVRERVEEGNRNAFMFRMARKFLWRHDDTDIAHRLFLEQAKYCEPELDERELASIYRSNQAYLSKKKQEGKYVPPSVYFKRQRVINTLEPDDYTDFDQANVMARYYYGKIAFSSATDFLVYKDNRWQEDKLLARRYSQLFTDAQLDEANKRLSLLKPKLDAAGGIEALKLKAKQGALSDAEAKLLLEYEKARSYREFVIKRRNTNKLQATLTELAPIVQVYVKDLDNKPFYLLTPSKTYDLRKGLQGATEPDSKNMITQMTSVDPSDAGKNIWEGFLKEVFDDDRELIDYVQTICGVAVIGKVYIEGIIIAYGDGGNGKSTFWNTIARVMGSYYGKISADALTTNCKRNVKPELAELRGKRLIIASESQEGARLAESEIKELCSTDDIKAEKKYKDPFEFTPTHTLVLYTNHLPKVKGTDDGIWRRIIVIPFNHKFTKGDNDVKNYSDYLYEKAGEYVLSWVIEGARKAYGNGFRIKNPKVVSDAINKYKKDNDWFGAFLDECCEVAPGLSCPSKECYRVYRDFCLSIGERPKPTVEFYTELERHDFKRVQSKNEEGKRQVFIHGFKLKKTDIIADFDFLE